MAIGRLNIGKARFTFVFRHRFEKPNEVIGTYRYHSEFRDWEIGLWFRKNKMVGRKDFNKPNKWKDNLVNSYMLGINLLICKAWVDWSIGGMYLGKE